MSMHVIIPGPRTTIQDAGRPGYQNHGFAPSGFIDRVASRRANVLVENADSEAVLEFCLMGPTLRFDEQVNLAVSGGDFGIDVDGKTYPADQAVQVPAGSTVRITTGKFGIYGSLAVGGGLDIPEVMGSRSTNLRCGIGGFKGRALMAGDEIALRDPENGQKDLSWRWMPARRLVSPEDEDITRVRVIPGPQESMFTEKGLRTFYESTYTVSSLSDRMGFRLEGPEVEAVDGVDILTDGIVNGSVQIVGNGKPIVLMADRQTTGGYAKIASLINVDIPWFAQLRPGQEVRFVKCTIQEAQRLLREANREWKDHCRLLEEEAERREKEAEQRRIEARQRQIEAEEARKQEVEARKRQILEEEAGRREKEEARRLRLREEEAEMAAAEEKRRQERAQAFRRRMGMDSGSRISTETSGMTEIRSEMPERRSEAGSPARNAAEAAGKGTGSGAGSDTDSRSPRRPGWDRSRKLWREALYDQFHKPRTCHYR